MNEFVINPPLITHKLALLRNKNTKTNPNQMIAAQFIIRPPCLMNVTINKESK